MFLFLSDLGAHTPTKPGGSQKGGELGLWKWKEGTAPSAYWI